MRSDGDELLDSYPELGRQIDRLRLARLPTPVRTARLARAGEERVLLIKEDNLSAEPYGGNKVRKLEYLLARARKRGRRTIATFGTAGSHHALATALYARQQGFDCLCFMSHQPRTAEVAETLRLHLEIGTEIVRFGGRYADRIATLRQHLRGRKAAVIPPGGSSWLGTLGFVNAALELVAQIGRGECRQPDRVYVATGTMGTAAGLALGFALCRVPIDVHAVRISPPNIANADRLQQLADKTALMMHRLDRRIPPTLGRELRLTWRHEFYGDGYARPDTAAEQAIDTARRDLGLQLERTYTGKAMAALLNDLQEPSGGQQTFLFWQSYHAAALPVYSDSPPDPARLPAEFLGYLS